MTTGVLADEADELQAGFLTRVRLGRPLVTLKLATTLDGRIATKTGESQWITGYTARHAAHVMRGQHDAVMVGVGTVLTDNPALTCRIPGFRETPVTRVVVDSHLRTRLTSALVVTAGAVPTAIIHRAGAQAERRQALLDLGVQLIEVPGSEAGVDLAAGAAGFGQDRVDAGCWWRGGAQIAAALLRAGLVDRLAWFHAPGVMGGDGWPAAQAFGVTTLEAMPRFVRTAAAERGGMIS